MVSVPLFLKRIGRKATFSTLVAITMVIVAGILLLAIGYKIFMYTSDSSDDEKCRMSIFVADAAAEIKETTEVVDVIPQLECKQKDIEIDVSDVTRTRNGKIDDIMMKQKVAEAIASCWNMVGAGDMFPVDKTFGFDRTYCMVCSKVTVSEKLKKKMDAEGYQLSNFYYYLATRRMPNTEISYWEYFGGKMATAEELAQYKSWNDVVPLSDSMPLYVTWRIDIIDNRLEWAGLILLGPSLPGLVLAGIFYAKADTTDRITFIQSILWSPLSEMSGDITLRGMKRTTCSTMLN